MVFQQTNPFPKSIYDNVAYGPRIHGLDDKNKLDQLVEESLRELYGMNLLLGVFQVSCRI